MFLGIEWRQPSNLGKPSLMDMQCDLNSYKNSDGFFICKILGWYESIEENSIHSLWNNIGSHINILFLKLSQFVTQLFGWSCQYFPLINWLGFTHSSFTLFVQMTYGTLLRRNGFYYFCDLLCLMNTGIIIVLNFIE